MAQPSRKREKAILQLEQLAPLDERPKSNTENAEHTYTKLNDVSKPRSQDILRVEAVRPPQIDEVGEGEIEVDVLETKKRGEKNPTIEER